MKLTTKIARAEAKKKEIEHELYMLNHYPHISRDLAKTKKSFEKQLTAVNTKIAKLLEEYYKF